MRAVARRAAGPAWGLLACLLLLAAGRPAGVGDQAPRDATRPDELTRLRIERGEGQLPLLVPRDEELSFKVRLGLGVLGSPSVGTVTLSASVEPFRQSSLVLQEQVEEVGERARLVAYAKGGYAVYNVEETITTLLLPQEWPSILLRLVQTGSENRRRQLMLGTREGEFVSRYRSDGHCGGCELREHFVEPTWAWQKPHHCRKCKRGEHRRWHAWKQRDVPTTALDMVSSVYLARSMIELGEAQVRFPLLDREELWQVDVRRGETRTVEVDAGKFTATQVLLSTRPAPGEDAKPEDFKGLFGIHGQVSIWFDANHGVPVLISGDVPIGPLDLSLRVELQSYRGTPPGFGPR